MTGERFIACGDNHGDMQEKGVVDTFLDFTRYWKPKIRIHVGDCFDLRWLRGRASEGEKREHVEADIDAGLSLISRYRPTHFLNGNHDHRLMKAAMSDTGPLADYAANLLDEVRDALGTAAVYKYDKRKGVMRLGDYNCIHGYHSGVTAPRQAAMVYGSCLMGHIHSVDSITIPHIGGPAVGMSIGCLCKLDMGYNEGQPGTLRQGHGFAYGVVRNGKATVWQAKPVGGVWMMPTEMREYGYGAKAA